jgi:hypothetical protein
MYLLHSLPPPDRSFFPQEFIPNSRAVFDATLRKITDTYQSTQPEVVRQWQTFAQSVPLNDSAQEHLANNPLSMRIPFKDLLFTSSEELMENQSVDSNQNASHKRKLGEIQILRMRSTDSIAWSRRGKKLRPNDPNLSLRVSRDCPPARYVSKYSKKNSSTTKICSNKTIIGRRKKNRDNESSDDDDSSSSSGSSTNDGTNTSDDDDNENNDDVYDGNIPDDEPKNHHHDSADHNNDDDENDEEEVCCNYDTDDEKVDENNYYHKRKNVQVARYGSALPYIGKIFSFANNTSRQGTIAAVVCQVGDSYNELYFKFYDHNIHQVCPDAYKNDSKNVWEYIKCNELMGSKKGLKWEGGNPGSIGESLVGMSVRRPFKVVERTTKKNWKWFNGEITHYLKGGMYTVQYEDGDVRDEKQSDVVMYLMYKF